MPDTIEKLKHRAGRTGRAGRKGTATVFVSKECTILREYRRLLRENHQVIIILYFYLQDVPDALDSILKKELFVCCDILVKCVYKTYNSFCIPKLIEIEIGNKQLQKLISMTFSNPNTFTL